MEWSRQTTSHASRGEGHFSHKPGVGGGSLLARPSEVTQVGVGSFHMPPGGGGGGGGGHFIHRVSVTCIGGDWYILRCWSDEIRFTSKKLSLRNEFPLAISGQDNNNRDSFGL